MKFKLQAGYVNGQWEDLRDSSDGSRELFDTYDEAWEELESLERELDDAKGMFRVVPENQYSPPDPYYD